jgi:hypothetical protein
VSHGLKTILLAIVTATAPAMAEPIGGRAMMASDFVGCFDPADEQAIFDFANDKEAFDAFLALKLLRRDCEILRAATPVHVDRINGFLDNQICVRRDGAAACLWIPLGFLLFGEGS